ncbi:hypothetical protein T484DRAFT_1785197 [Baffinella frigidus]|nr:hypothetical protein T484DRAFT_1785197 [Cryptophyta sp. CCMP2293]
MESGFTQERGAATSYQNSSDKGLSEVGGRRGDALTEDGGGGNVTDSGGEDGEDEECEDGGERGAVREEDKDEDEEAGGGGGLRFRAPRVRAVAPHIGPRRGGTRVTILGDGNISRISDSEIVCVSAGGEAVGNGASVQLAGLSGGWDPAFGTPQV